MLGLAWDTGFLRTFKGMAMSGQIVISLIGGVLSFITGAGFEKFIYCSVICITGLLLFTHVSNLTNLVEAKIPYLGKLRLFYLLIWIVLTVICLIIDIIAFLTSFLYVFLNIGLVIALGIDLAITYRGTSSGGPAATLGVGASSTENLESGDAARY